VFTVPLVVFVDRVSTGRKAKHGGRKATGGRVDKPRTANVPVA
jgi:hypothetical protein